MSKDDKGAPLSANDMLGDDAHDDDLEAVLDAAEEDVPEEDRHALLTPAEVRAARETARKKFEAAEKKTATDALVAQEMNRLRGPAGLRTGDPQKDEPVTVSLDLAEHSDGITINGEKFFHGHTYTLPRHVCDSLREIQARGQDHQNELDGKGIADRFRRPRMTLVSGKTGVVSNAPQAVN